MIGSPTLTNYTFSKTPTINFNTVPPSIARSATGSVYAVGDTGYTTPLNMTMVIGGAVVTTISSDALGLLPDFTLLDRTTCVWKQTGSSFATVLTTSDPIPGPASTVPGPPGAPGVADDASMAAIANSETSAFRGALNATYASFANLARNPDLIIAGAVTRDANGAATSAAVVWPDGKPGTYTATTLSTAFPGAVDAYTVTYGSPVIKTFTQPAVTRDATGAATNVPAITVS